MPADQYIRPLQPQPIEQKETEQVENRSEVDLSIPAKIKLEDLQTPSPIPDPVPFKEEWLSFPTYTLEELQTATKIPLFPPPTDLSTEGENDLRRQLYKQNPSRYILSLLESVLKVYDRQELERQHQCHPVLKPIPPKPVPSSSLCLLLNKLYQKVQHDEQAVVNVEDDALLNSLLEIEEEELLTVDHYSELKVDYQQYKKQRQQWAKEVDAIQQYNERIAHEDTSKEPLYLAHPMIRPTAEEKEQFKKEQKQRKDSKVTKYHLVHSPLLVHEKRYENLYEQTGNPYDKDVYSRLSTFYTSAFSDLIRDLPKDYIPPEPVLESIGLTSDFVHLDTNSAILEASKEYPYDGLYNRQTASLMNKELLYFMNHYQEYEYQKQFIIEEEYLSMDYIHKVCFYRYPLESRARREEKMETFGEIWLRETASGDDVVLSEDDRRSEDNEIVSVEEETIDNDKGSGDSNSVVPIKEESIVDNDKGDDVVPIKEETVDNDNGNDKGSGDSNEIVPIKEESIVDNDKGDVIVPTEEETTKNSNDVLPIEETIDNNNEIVPIEESTIDNDSGEDVVLTEEETVDNNNGDVLPIEENTVDKGNNNEILLEEEIPKETENSDNILPTEETPVETTTKMILSEESLPTETNITLFSENQTEDSPFSLLLSPNQQDLSDNSFFNDKSSPSTSAEKEYELYSKNSSLFESAPDSDTSPTIELSNAVDSHETTPSFMVTLQSPTTSKSEEEEHSDSSGSDQDIQSPASTPSSPQQEISLVATSTSSQQEISLVTTITPSSPQEISLVTTTIPSPQQEISLVTDTIPSPQQDISPVATTIPSPQQEISPVATTIPSPQQEISPSTDTPTDSDSPQQDISPVATTPSSPSFPQSPITSFPLSTISVYTPLQGGQILALMAPLCPLLLFVHIIPSWLCLSFHSSYIHGEDLIFSRSPFYSTLVFSPGVRFHLLFQLLESLLSKPTNQC